MQQSEGAQVAFTLSIEESMKQKYKTKKGVDMGIMGMLIYKSCRAEAQILLGGFSNKNPVDSRMKS